MGSGSSSASPEELLAEVEWVRRVARALVGRGEIDDVVQQTWVQALSTPPAAGPVRRWLSTVVRNVVRRHARDEATRGRHELRAPVPARTPEPGETVARVELHRQVVEAVLALDEPYRSTLLLRFFEDQPAEAIARAQSLPVETVRTRVKRGLVQLRTRLEKAAGGDDAAGIVARALWFERLGTFAEEGGKGAVAGGAAVAAGAIAMTARAAWIAWGLAAAAVLVSGAAWWHHAKGAWAVETSPTHSARANAPSGSTTQHAPTHDEAASADPSIRATRTSELPAAASVSRPPGAMKPLVGGDRGVIRGRVSNARGEPVARAEVRASRLGTWGGATDLAEYAAAAWRRARSNEPQPVPSGVVVARSDAKGGFEFRGLSTFADWYVGAFDLVEGAAICDPVRFDQDAPTREIELTLLAGSFVHGSVRDDAGRPIAEASVNFGSSRGQGSLWTWFATKADGTWSAGFWCGERVATSVEAPGFVGAPLQWTKLETGKADLELAIVLHSNGDRLVEGPIVVTESETGATPNGVGVNAALEAALGSAEEDRSIGPPPPGHGRIAVGAVRSDDAPPRLAAPPVPGSRDVDGGTFGRVDVDRSRYEVMLPADFRGSLFLAVHGVVVGTARIESIDVPPPLPLEVKLIPPRRVATRLAVRVIDAQTRGPIDLACGWVAATAPLPSHTPLPSIPRRDPKSGVEEFVVSPTRVAIRADFDGYASTSTEIVVGPEERHREVTIALDRATAGIRGRALRVDGSAIQESGVALYRISPDGVMEARGGGGGTNMYGEFEVVGLAAAEYVVVVTAPDEACAVTRVLAADPPTEFELHAVPGTSTEFRLKPPIAPSRTASPPSEMFRIVDEEGIPLVNTFGGWSSSSGYSDTLEAILRPGSYKITVWRGGFRETTRAFDVPSDEPIELELEPAR